MQRKRVRFLAPALALLAALILEPAMSKAARADPPATINPAARRSQPGDTDQQIRDAYMLQLEGKWDAAVAKWTELSQVESLNPRQQIEVEQNLQLAKKLAGKPETAWKREDGDSAGTPAQPIPEDEILNRYPKGRTTTSRAIFDIVGTGVNERWYLKASGHFALQMQTTATTKVLENTGSRLTLEIEFAEVVQRLGRSELDKLEIRWPADALLLNVADQLAENTAPWPIVYRTIRGSARELAKADPGFSNMLTGFAKGLEARGVNVTDSGAVLDWAAQFEPLSGKKIRVDYVPELGITQIDVLNDQTLPRETLANLAHHGSLLMDHYLFPSLEKRPDSVWTVRAADVASFVGMGFDASASGNLVIRRHDDLQRKGEKLAHLSLAPASQVWLTFQEGGQDVRVGLEPRKSELFYSPQGFLVREARIEWRTNMVRVPKFLLLYGTTEIKAECKSHYEAVRHPAENK